MAVKASANITLFHMVDIDSTTIYYLLQSSTANPPAKPTTDNPGGNWTTTEPTYTEGSTNTLYTVTKTKYSDGTFEYTPVSKSSSYEAAKSAYNKALNTEQVVNNLQIGGRNYILESNTFTSGGSADSGTGSTSNTIHPSIENGLWKVIVDTPTNSNWNSWSHKNIIEDNFKENDKFVFSFDIKSSDANITRPPNIYFKSGMGYYGMTGSVSSEWSRVYYAGSWKDTNPISFHLGWNGLQGTYYIRKLKFEVGTKPSDWTPAPEDVDEAILSVDTKHDYIVGTQTAATRFWTGVSNITTLKDGQEIVYWLPYATAYTNAGDRTVGVNMRVNSSTTKNAGTTIISFETGTSTNVVWLNLTLQGGNQTGWIPCYYGGTSRLTGHYGAGNAIRLVYRVNAKVGGEAATAQYTGWFADANYDTNNTDRLRFQNNVKMGKQYVWNNRILGGTDDGYFPIHSSVTIDKDRAILWNGNNTAPYGTNNNTYLAYSSWDMRYNAYQYYSSSAWQNGTKFNLLDVQLGSSNKIYSGTGITGNSTTATIFSGSGVSSAVVNDRYINTSTGYYYKCTVAGAASAAKWVYEGDSTIPAGKRLYWGTHLTHTDGTAKTTATAISSAGVGDRYINHSTGRLYECTTAGASGTAQWTDKGVIIKNNKTLYLVGVLHGQSITIDDVPFTTEPPTEEDGKVYIALGDTYNIYTSGLFPEHPLFMFKDGSFKSMDQITYDTSVIAKKAKEDAETAKTAITDFLEGEDDGSFTAYKRQVESDISTATGEITNNFSTYIAESDIYQNNIKAAVEMAAKIDSYIKMSTNNQGQPYMELGVQPSTALPNTYRLRIENNEIYMVYGSGNTETLTKLTRWYTSDGKSSFDVNTLVTQQEMAITPFRFIKNDDGSLSFRKVE